MPKKKSAKHIEKYKKMGKPKKGMTPDPDSPILHLKNREGLQKKIDRDEIPSELKHHLEKMNIYAANVRRDYKKNSSEESGSVVRVHENSPSLDSHLDSDEPLYSGSRWTHVIKTK